MEKFGEQIACMLLNVKWTEKIKNLKGYKCKNTRAHILHFLPTTTGVRT